MSVIDEWARRHGVSAAALADLRASLCVGGEPPPTIHGGTPEARVLGAVRLAASAAGWRLWRNNVGAVHTSDGGFVRFGLANESSQMNLQIKSSDLIGIRPVRIGVDHLGRDLGQFAAIECKRPEWRRGSSAREAAQERYLALVEQLGGYARFSTGGIE